MEDDVIELYERIIESSLMSFIADEYRTWFYESGKYKEEFEDCLNDYDMIDWYCDLINCSLEELVLMAEKDND